MHRMAAILLALAVAGAAPAFAAQATGAKAEQTLDVKGLGEQVKSLQDANVVMKEDLAKTQLQIAESDAQHRAQLEAMNKDLAQLRQQWADERAAHEAALAKAQAEAARQRAKSKEQQKWLYILGGAVLLIAASQ